jgi:fibronectin-binding autotransporter adhesin
MANSCSAKRVLLSSTAALVASTAISLADEIADITDATVSNAAQQRDATLNAINDAINGVPTPPTDISSITLPADNGTPPQVFDGVSLPSPVAGSPALDLTGQPGNDVRLINGTSIANTQDNAPGISTASVDAATSVFLDDSSISTGGIDSAGLDTGAFDNSVFLGRISNSQLSTTGNGSAGILLGDGTAGGSTAVLSIVSDGTGTQSAITTTGENADAIAVDTSGTGMSSVIVAVENSIVDVTGANSEGIDLDIWGTSDALVRLEDATVTTTGNAVSVVGGDESLFDVVVIDSAVEATGIGSEGLSLGAGGGRVENTFVRSDLFVGSSQVNADGPAVNVERLGVASGDRSNVFDSTLISNGAGVGTVALTNAGTLVADQNSLSTLAITDTDIFLNGPGAAVLHEGLGRRSAMLTQILGGTIAATGNDAAAVVIGVNRPQDFSNSGQSVNIENTMVSTSGGNANAVAIHEAEGENSDYTTAIRDPRIRTTGENSAGLSFIPGSTPYADMNVTRSVIATVETSGDNSAGMVLGALANGTSGSTMLQSIQGSSVQTSGNGSTGIVMGVIGGTGAGNQVINALSSTSIETTGDDAVGFHFAGAGPGQTDLTQTNAFVLDITTSGANSHGAVLSFSEADGASTSTNAITMDVQVTGLGADAVQVTGNANAGGTRPDLTAAVEEGQVLSSTQGFAFLETGVDTTMTVEGTVAGMLDFGSGDDIVAFSGPGVDISGLTGIDGGTGTNTLTLDGVDSSLTGDVDFAGFAGPAQLTSSTINFFSADIDGLALTLDSASTLNSDGASRIGGAFGSAGYSLLNQGTLSGGLSVDGSVRMDGGRLALSIFGASSFDQLLVAGSFDVLNSFDLFLDFGSFVPQVGDLYEIVVASSQATTFDPLDAISLSFGGISPTDGLFDLRFNDGVLALAVNGQAPPPDIAPIPVPAAFPMLLSALGFVAVLKRRRRHAA